MAKKVATVLGIGFLLVGLLGFVAPGFLGAHLSPAHNIVHLVTGAVSLWLGLKGSLGAAKAFCIAFGAVYLLLAVGGFVLGTQAEPSVHAGPSDAKLWKVIPGTLEFGTADHIIHILLGGIYFIAGLMTRATVAATARR
jgi:hypothetical protein